MGSSASLARDTVPFSRGLSYMVSSTGYFDTGSSAIVLPLSQDDSG